MNLANRLTMSRILLTFVFMFFLFCQGLWAKAASLIVFILAALSDLFDGMIAQRLNMVTDFGRLMDPIADKILVLAAFAAFVQMQLIDAWMFVIIVSREILITSLRLFALNKGKVLSAARAGKHKTVSQMVAVIAVLVFLIIKDLGVGFRYTEVFEAAVYLLMLVTVGMTITSGVSYMIRNKDIFMGDK